MSITIQEIAAKLRKRTEDVGISPREFEVLRLICNGKISKQIACELGTSQNTIDNQRATIMKKLGAKTPAHMVWIACQRGLV
jgi:two-component system invasion response regulator UvrY